MSKYKSHRLTATQAYLTENPLCCVTSTNAVLMVRVKLIRKKKSGLETGMVTESYLYAWWKRGISSSED